MAEPLTAAPDVYFFTTQPQNLVAAPTNLGRVSNHAAAGAAVVDPTTGSRANAITAITGVGLITLTDDNGLEVSLLTVRT